MSKLQQAVANCPPGMETMFNGCTFVYANESSKANYSSFGFEVVTATAAPAEVEDVQEEETTEKALTSADFSAKDAKELIEDNNYAWCVGFVSEDEQRKSVLAALEAKKND